MLKKMSIKCAAAILAAGLMMSSAGNMVGVAGACSVAVYASELEDSGEGGSGSGNQSGEDDQSGGDDQTGGDEESGSDTTLDEEEDTQGDSAPSVGGMRTMSPAPPANEGEGGGPSLGNGEDPYYTETNTEHLAENPSGHTIGTNNAIIDTNNGTIGDASINEETGEYVIDHDTGNYHIIHENNGTVYYNGGEIKWNYSGLVVENGFMVGVNHGTIKVNLSTIKPVQNSGTIEKNMEGAQVDNQEGGRVEENSGVVYNYGGTVGTNTATGTEYFSVTVTYDQRQCNYSRSGLSQGKWLGQTGSTQGMATLIFTPLEGYEIVSISGWDQNISEENGVWTVGITSGANISIQVNVVEKEPEPEPEPEPEKSYSGYRERKNDNDISGLLNNYSAKIQPLKNITAEEQLKMVTLYSGYLNLLEYVNLINANTPGEAIEDILKNGYLHGKNGNVGIGNKNINLSKLMLNPYSLAILDYCTLTINMSLERFADLYVEYFNEEEMEGRTIVERRENALNAINAIYINEIKGIAKKIDESDIVYPQGVDTEEEKEMYHRDYVAGYVEAYRSCANTYDCNNYAYAYANRAKVSRDARKQAAEDYNLTPGAVTFVGGSFDGQDLVNGMSVPTAGQAAADGTLQGGAAADGTLQGDAAVQAQQLQAMQAAAAAQAAALQNLGLGQNPQDAVMAALLGQTGQTVGQQTAGDVAQNAMMQTDQANPAIDMAYGGQDVWGINFFSQNNGMAGIQENPTQVPADDQDIAAILAALARANAR